MMGKYRSPSNDRKSRVVPASLSWLRRKREGKTLMGTRASPYETLLLAPR